MKSFLGRITKIIPEVDQERTVGLFLLETEESHQATADDTQKSTSQASQFSKDSI